MVADDITVLTVAASMSYYSFFSVKDSQILFIYHWKTKKSH